MARVGMTGMELVKAMGWAITKQKAEIITKEMISEEHPDVLAQGLGDLRYGRASNCE